jgi:hypothetical protein
LWPASDWIWLGVLAKLLPNNIDNAMQNAR